MEPEPATLLSLPLILAHRIVLALPVEQRARCATVCRGWRALLAESSLWSRLDLCETSGVTCRVDAEALRGAPARAGGVLLSLSVRHRDFRDTSLPEVLTAHRHTLRELRLGRTLLTWLTPLLELGLTLYELSADVECDANVQEARKLLVNEAPYTSLRMQALTLNPPHFTGDTAGLAALAAALPQHASLRSLKLVRAFMHNQAVCEKLVDGVLAAPLTSLELSSFVAPAGFAPTLARLLRGQSLSTLVLSELQGVFTDKDSCAMLAEARRANTTLTSLTLLQAKLWLQWRWPERSEKRAGTLLLAALEGHPSLRKLDFRCKRRGRDDPHDEADVAAAGDALGALVAAHAPALRELNVSQSSLGDYDGVGLFSLCGALWFNTHLRSLNLAFNEITEEFAVQRLLPAVRNNTSLLQVTVAERDEPGMLLQTTRDQIEQLVKARTAPRNSDEQSVLEASREAAAAKAAEWVW